MQLTNQQHARHASNYYQNIEPQKLTCLPKSCFTKKRNLIFSTMLTFLLVMTSIIMLTIFSTTTDSSENDAPMYAIFLVLGIVTLSCLTCCCLSGAGPEQIIDYLISCLYLKKGSLENRQYTLQRKKETAIAAYRNARRPNHASQTGIVATEDTPLLAERN